MDDHLNSEKRLSEFWDFLSKNRRLVDLRSIIASDENIVPSKIKRNLSNIRKRLGFVTDKEMMEDAELRAALIAFDKALKRRAGLPTTWRIGGGALLLQEFIMPRLGELEKQLEVEADIQERVQLETRDIGFKGGMLYNAVNDGTVQVVVANGLRIKQEFEEERKKGKLAPFRIHCMNEGRLEECNDEKHGASSLSRLDVGTFEYKLHVPTWIVEKNRNISESRWLRKVPLIVPDHSPRGIATIKDAAKELGYHVGHQCPGIPSALAAIQAPKCQYASILPTYLSVLPSLLEQGTLESFDLPGDEFENHTISVLWKGKFLNDCPEPRRRAERMIVAIATYIKKRLESI